VVATTVELTSLTNRIFVEGKARMEVVMFIRYSILPLIFFLVTLGTASQQQDSANKQALQQRIAELKESVAANKANLQKYKWTETTMVELKGETKKTEQKLCQYGPDGKVQKTPIGPQEQPQGQSSKRGLKGRVVERKVGEMKDYMERLKSLVGQYVPPNRDKIQEAFQSGQADLNPSGGGVASLILNNYYKPGDKVTFAFDKSAKRIKSFVVNTYLDDPKDDIVNLTANFASLADGTNYVSQTDLQSMSKHIEIKTVNSQYQKLSP
jgi:hypothetical protein